MKKFICTSPHNTSAGASCFWGDISDTGYVDGTPIEDLGMFFIIDEEITPKSADRIFIALLGDAEGEAPEVKEEITRDDELFRPLYMPHLLTPKEFEIFKILIDND